MKSANPTNSSPWDDAIRAATLFAVDPVGTVGVAVRGLHGPVRERWLALVRYMLPGDAAWRRIPLDVSDGRLLGGLDLAATLQAGRPVAERGILTDADGGVVLLAMAERLSPSTAARLGAVLDAAEVVVERDGFALRIPSRFGVIALDEGATEEESPPQSLLDRLAFYLDLAAVSVRDVEAADVSLDEIAAARGRLPNVVAQDQALEALCAAAFSLGIRSVRAPLLALRVARAAAALAGRIEVAEVDAALAAQLVLAPRATVLPGEQPPATEEPPENEGDDVPNGESGASAPRDDADEITRDPNRPLEDVVLAAARASIPPDLLARLRLTDHISRSVRSVGRSGAIRQSRLRGRPAGVRRGELRSGTRLNVVETLRAAAPWQGVRRRDRDSQHAPSDAPGAVRIDVRREDFRFVRFKQHTQTATIFVVDASGSAALHRLAEAKGAVEILLADCYVRRDRVALVAFRGRGAEIVLPPTRSLVRAKRSLASLPGGGGTPLAAGIDAAAALAESAKRRGETPVVIFLTDGRANVARDGSTGRATAEADALVAARALRAAGLTTLLLDTSPHSQPQAERLAVEMRALYLPLPHADAAVLSSAIRTATSSPNPR